MTLDTKISVGSMLGYWIGTNPKLRADELVANLLRRFGKALTANEAWIEVARFRNQRHTKGIL
jgi:hypothetical protein